MEKEDRIVFLACFTPTRLSSILEKTEDESKKDQIMTALLQIDSVTFDKVDDVFKKAEEVFQSKKEKAEEVVVPVILTRIASMSAFIFRRS